MGRIHKVSRQIACGANSLARFSTRIHFVRWSSTSKVWRTFVEGKKGNYALPSLLGLSWVFLQKRIHVNLSWSGQQQRVFEETFTDWLWRLVRHVEDSLNRAGLLASTTLLLMPACKSNGWSPFRLQAPPHQVKGRLCPPRARRRGTSTGLSSNHRRRRSYQIPL